PAGRTVRLSELLEQFKAAKAVCVHSCRPCFRRNAQLTAVVYGRSKYQTSMPRRRALVIHYGGRTAAKPGEIGATFLSIAERPEPADAILAIDVGNTRVGLAVVDDDGTHHAVRIPVATPGEWKQALDRTWASMSGAGRKAVALASVNPQAAREFI